MMNQPVHMMDIFILRHNLFFASLDNDFAIDENSSYPVKVKDYGLLDISPYVALEFNWETAAFDISAVELLRQHFGKFELTFSNAKSLCLNLLASLEPLELVDGYAALQGYSIESYSAGQPENFGKLKERLGLVAHLFGPYYSHIDGNNTAAAYSVKCRTKAADTLLEKVEFTFKGNWK
jgi:hypothetical protein